MNKSLEELQGKQENDVYFARLKAGWDYKDAAVGTRRNSIEIDKEVLKNFLAIGYVTAVVGFFVGWTIVSLILK